MMSHPRAAYCRTRYNGENQVRSELSLSVTEIIASGQRHCLAAVPGMRHQPCYISHSGRSIMTMPSASMTAPLSSLSQRPVRSVSLRLPSAITAAVAINVSSAM